MDITNFYEMLDSMNEKEFQEYLLNIKENNEGENKDMRNIKQQNSKYNKNSRTVRKIEERLTQNQLDKINSYFGDELLQIVGSNYLVYLPVFELVGSISENEEKKIKATAGEYDIVDSVICELSRTDEKIYLTVDKENYDMEIQDNGLVPCSDYSGNVDDMVHSTFEELDEHSPFDEFTIVYYVPASKMKFLGYGSPLTKNIISVEEVKKEIDEYGEKENVDINRIRKDLGYDNEVTERYMKNKIREKLETTKRRQQIREKLEMVKRKQQIKEKLETARKKQKIQEKIENLRSSKQRNSRFYK